jgi:hypothetical protein
MSEIEQLEMFIRGYMENLKDTPFDNGWSACSMNALAGIRKFWPDPRDALIGTDVSDAAIAEEEARERDATIARLSAQVEAGFRFYESCPHWGRCHGLMPDKFSYFLVDDKCVCELIRAVLAKLSKGA